MFSFLKKNNKRTNVKKEEVENSFLEVENSVFHTEDSNNTFQDNVDYESLIYQPPVYDDVPKYKARNNSEISVIIDKEQLGFNAEELNKNIKTLEFEPQQGEERIELVPEENEKFESEINEPVVEAVSMPVEDIFLVDNLEDKEPPEDDKQFSIFGSVEGYTDIKNYADSDYKEEQIELDKDVNYTDDGYKVCPNCGTILNPKAPVCFMCSKSFIKNR